jgi:cell fate regulator YaaT (PSP1 superfamily)
MACATGCGSKENGGCNRLNTFDWLSAMHVDDPNPFNIVEVSFKDGARKEFFHNQEHLETMTGDNVVIESKNGYDIGRISLSGELVRLQMKKKRTSEEKVVHKVLRIATERDMERQKEVRGREMQTMVRSRAIARTLDLDMKIGDVEYQADGRKATFFYTADGRVDFRELIRHYASEFKVKIEMRQIGARQESSRIGGVGSCGRELCCSTWLTNFKSVSTAAARYQNLAINQAKLSGQCGRLKCCLNYELDTYMDALTHFPKDAEKIQTESGQAILVKTDIFKGLMFYAYRNEKGRSRIFGLEVATVKGILELNASGQKPADLSTLHYISPVGEEDEVDFEGDVTGVIELPIEKKKRNRGGGRRNQNRSQNQNRSRGRGNNPSQSNKPGNKPKPKPKQDAGKDGAPQRKNEAGKPEENKNRNKSNRNRNRNRNRRNNNRNKNDNNNDNNNDNKK